jgi:pantoate--beta-alanine ligase
LKEKGFIPDYIEVRRQSDLQIPNDNDTALVVVASTGLGKARLIDNIAFDVT